MNRTPLVRRTPLSRGTVRLRPRSARRAVQERRYQRESREFLQHKVCVPHAAMGVLHAATEVHHMRGRVGALLLDRRWWLEVCRDAHHRITVEPAWAIAEGWSLSRLSEPEEEW